MSSDSLVRTNYLNTTTIDLRSYFLYWIKNYKTGRRLTYTRHTTEQGTRNTQDDEGEVTNRSDTRADGVKIHKLIVEHLSREHGREVGFRQHVPLDGQHHLVHGHLVPEAEHVVEGVDLEPDAVPF